MYSYIATFPKKDRFTLGQKCEQISLRVLELLFLANAKRADERMSLFRKIDVKLKILKTLVRLAFEVQAIDQKKYIMLEASLLELGKMLGGWIKSLSKENPT